MTNKEYNEAVRPLEDRVKELEAEVRELKNRADLTKLSLDDLQELYERLETEVTRREQQEEMADKKKEEQE